MPGQNGMDGAPLLNSVVAALVDLIRRRLALPVEKRTNFLWVRPSMLIGATVEQFIEYWQVKRGGDKRGIVDVLL